MSAPRVGEDVEYHSPFRTGVYDGIVRRVNEDGTVAVAVYVPGLSTSRHKGDLEPAIVLRAVSYGPAGRARPMAK